MICSLTRFSCSSASATGLDDVVERHLRRGDAGDRGVEVLVDQELGHHQRVVALLERLRVEERREARERLRIEVDGDGDVLLMGGELVADLLVEPLDEGGDDMAADPIGPAPRIRVS